MIATAGHKKIQSTAIQTVIDNLDSTDNVIVVGTGYTDDYIGSDYTGDYIEYTDSLPQEENDMMLQIEEMEAQLLQKMRSELDDLRKHMTKLKTKPTKEVNLYKTKQQLTSRRMMNGRR